MSYAAEDRDSARALFPKLVEAGLEPWDPAEALFPGDNWALQIGQALEDSDAMLILVSPHSMKSEWVRHELEYALASTRYKGRLLPVIVKATSDMPWILKRFPSVRLGSNLTEASRQISDYLTHGFELSPVNA